MLRASVHKTIKDQLNITVVPPIPEHTAYLEAILELSEWDTEMLPDEDLSRKSSKKSSRRLARAEFCKVLTGNPESGVLNHHCPLGCCPGGRDESVRRLQVAVDELFFSSMIPIPAVNRWTKLFPAIVFC